MSETGKPLSNTQERLIELIAPLIAPLGYDVVHIEVQNHRQKILRLFIDHSDPSKGGIGVEDCVAVTRALDEPLDQLTEVEAVFKGAYELEVSSPGVDRPLRREQDYARFNGKEARIHVYRALTAEEIENGEYQQKNPKQKNFLGVLQGVRDGKVALAIIQEGSVSKAPGKKAKGGKPKAKTTNSVEEETGPKGPRVMIPLPLISKANLEPKFELPPESGSEIEI